MADKNNRVEKNVDGKWYVDKNCIDCDLCRTTAPTIFLHSDDGYTYVGKQPDGGEATQAEQAMGECPVEAIGNDG